MTDKVFTPTVEMNEVLKSSGSHNKETALAATAELARALELPLRKGLLSGDILNNIFEPIRMEPVLLPNFLWISCLPVVKRIS